jgi:hypothetical protein
LLRTHRRRRFWVNFSESSADAVCGRSEILQRFIECSTKFLLEVLSGPADVSIHLAHLTNNARKAFRAEDDESC